jgi:hypothetical protein
VENQEKNVENQKILQEERKNMRIVKNKKA